jgi:hypothetical protein
LFKSAIAVDPFRKRVKFCLRCAGKTARHHLCCGQPFKSGNPQLLFHARFNGLIILVRNAGARHRIGSNSRRFVCPVSFAPAEKPDSLNAEYIMSAIPGGIFAPKAN